MTGQVETRASIQGVTNAKPTVITTTAAHGFVTGQSIRFSDLGKMGTMPDGTDISNRGMVQLDGERYNIVVLSTTTFSIYSPVTGKPIDSTDYVPYVSGGSVNVVTHVNALNKPEQRPYSPSNQYPENPFYYVP